MDLTIEIKGPRASDEALELAASLTSVEGIRISEPPEPSKLDLPTIAFVVSVVSASVNLPGAVNAVMNLIDRIRKPAYTYTITLPNGQLLTFEGPEARRRAEQALKNYEESQNKD
jgi:hypothetical protein